MAADDVQYWELHLRDLSHGCDCCPWAVLTGAAVAFGLIGMAEAIRENHPAPVPCRACSIEAEIGTEENPHPVPLRFHTCKPLLVSTNTMASPPNRVEQE
jgi:hypothetical protein